MQIYVQETMLNEATIILCKEDIEELVRIFVMLKGELDAMRLDVRKLSEMSSEVRVSVLKKDADNFGNDKNNLPC